MRLKIMNGKIPNKLYLAFEEAFYSGITDFFVLSADVEPLNSIRLLKEKHPGVRIFTADSKTGGTIYMSEKFF